MCLFSYAAFRMTQRHACLKADHPCLMQTHLVLKPRDAGRVLGRPHFSPKRCRRANISRHVSLLTSAQALDRQHQKSGRVKHSRVAHWPWPYPKLHQPSNTRLRDFDMGPAQQTRQKNARHLRNGRLMSDFQSVYTNGVNPPRRLLSADQHRSSAVPHRIAPRLH